MTSRNKVLKLRPGAVAEKSVETNHYLIVIENVIYAFQPRESWAWAEAYRNLKGK